MTHSDKRPESEVDVEGMIVEAVTEARIARKAGILNLFGEHGEEVINQALSNLTARGRLIGLYQEGTCPEDVSSWTTYYKIPNLGL